MKRTFFLLLTLFALAAGAMVAGAQTNPPPVVQLAWNPVTGVGATYTLLWGTNSGQYFNNAVTTNPFVQVTNLLRGVTYYFTVNANVSGLVSPNSAEISYQVLNTPSAPSGFTIIIISH